LVVKPARQPWKNLPGDDIAEKQYQRNQAAGENNLSMLKSLWNRSTKSKPNVDLGPTGDWPKDVNGSVMLSNPRIGFPAIERPTEEAAESKNTPKADQST
jgi:hypothetical protein